MAVQSRDRRSDPGVGLPALPTVAIVGRPNVGKSTLFNRIVGERLAIVAERAGVTRDRQFSPTAWADRDFLLADTGGVLDVPADAMDDAVRGQVMAAVEHADVILFVVDARAGVHALDTHLAELLRRTGLPVVLAANKVDEPHGASAHFDFYRLGLGDPEPVSALSGKGSGDLLDEVVARLPPEPPVSAGVDVALRLAVVGKPNVGKSSFVNRLLRQDRVIVHEEAGTTRDAIDTYVEFENELICLIDTAGLRRRSRVQDEVEFYSRLRAAGAIRRADVCLLLVDCTAGVTNQDFRIGDQVWKEGKGLVLVANKWDLIEERGPDVVARFTRGLKERAPYLRWTPVVTASALTGKRVHTAVEAARRVQAERSRRIPTAEVNRVLRERVARQQPPQGGRGDVRILYGSQVATEPPLFVIFSNRPEEIRRSYLRYLENGFRAAWGFEGTPIRLKRKKREAGRGRGFRP